MNISINKSWDLEKSETVARLYEEAFGAKFSSAIPDKTKRLAILSRSFIPEFSYVAVIGDEVVGLAGFQVPEGSLTGGMSFSKLQQELGAFSGLWAGLVLSLFERKPKLGELVMDGIVVDGNYRGSGIGSELLDSIISHARDNGFDTVRLDVIDSNPRARKLYESKGFVAIKTEHFPYLKWLIGFSGSTTMVLKVVSQ
ncbi:GNAT family N-acetyltransferase [Neptunomonas japonica]|uniref:GNAT family N-acetyltransferase n=1 Tax=Neptunomonas japonica TaxID=417574 RepID=UPI00041272A8|nr:GNAT family N-acetyltransferase [Neptunomonas japonica]